ncbi:hypothetical protein GIB67_020866 [Kingdonia uniflora]|uniref:RNase H type-1 domain-containing protein n=1 Tax=Kingdonia uniflora TaxID=39325 RepID=A0A7J7M7D6_9MAGN|nr:hypothetical protein GIB67_020866 [Kingdonia uniflora]
MLKELEEELKKVKESKAEIIKVAERCVEMFEREETLEKAMATLRVGKNNMIQSYLHIRLIEADITLGLEGRFHEIVFSSDVEDELVEAIDALVNIPLPPQAEKVPVVGTEVKPPPEAEVDSERGLKEANVELLKERGAVPDPARVIFLAQEVNRSRQLRNREQSSRSSRERKCDGRVYRYRNVDRSYTKIGEVQSRCKALRVWNKRMNADLNFHREALKNAAELNVKIKVQINTLEAEVVGVRAAVRKADKRAREFKGLWTVAKNKEKDLEEVKRKHNKLVKTYWAKKGSLENLTQILELNLMEYRTSVEALTSFNDKLGADLVIAQRDLNIEVDQRCYNQFVMEESLAMLGQMDKFMTVIEIAELAMPDMGKLETNEVHDKEMDTILTFFAPEFKRLEKERDTIYDSLIANGVKCEIQLVRTEYQERIMSIIGVLTKNKFDEGGQIVAAKVPELMCLQPSKGGESSRDDALTELCALGGVGIGDSISIGCNKVIRAEATFADNNKRTGLFENNKQSIDLSLLPTPGLKGNIPVIKIPEFGFMRGKGYFPVLLDNEDDKMKIWGGGPWAKLEESEGNNEVGIETESGASGSEESSEESEHIGSEDCDQVLETQILLPDVEYWQQVKINSDESSRGNPGKGSVGFIIRNHTRTVLRTYSHRVGNVTSYMAKCSALLQGLQDAASDGWEIAWSKSDSVAAVEAFNNNNVPWQLKGDWKVVKTKMQQIIIIST